MSCVHLWSYDDQLYVYSLALFSNLVKGFLLVYKRFIFSTSLFERSDKRTVLRYRASPQWCTGCGINLVKAVVTLFFIFTSCRNLYIPMWKPFPQPACILNNCLFHLFSPANVILFQSFRPTLHKTSHPALT